MTLNTHIPREKKSVHLNLHRTLALGKIRERNDSRKLSPTTKSARFQLLSVLDDMVLLPKLKNLSFSLRNSATFQMPCVYCFACCSFIEITHFEWVIESFDKTTYSNWVIWNERKWNEATYGVPSGNWMVSVDNGDD